MRKIQIKKTKKKTKKVEQISIIAKIWTQIKKIKVQFCQDKRIENINLIIDKMQINVDIFIKEKNKENKWFQIANNQLFLFIKRIKFIDSNLIYFCYYFKIERQQYLQYSKVYWSLIY